MAQTKPIFSFAAGEVSPAFIARSDVQKYDQGLLRAANFFVDFKGGVNNRPGSEFIARLSGTVFRLATLSTLGDDILLVFSPNKVRFVQDGVFQLEADKTPTAAGSAFTLAAHGYAEGDMIWLESDSVHGYFDVTLVAGDTFTLNCPAVTGSVTVARVFTLETVFGADVLPTLRFRQRYNSVRVTSTEIPRYDIAYEDGTWSVSRVSDAGVSSVRPVITSYRQDNGGGWHIAFKVTAVVDGIEGPPSDAYTINDTQNYSKDSGWVTISFTGVPNAEYYNVYRTLFNIYGEETTKYLQFGYIGQTKIGEFSDTNITPDFTKSPPEPSKPFYGGRITGVNVLLSGSSYTTGDTATVVDDDGEGAIVELVVADANGINSVAILSADLADYSLNSFGPEPWEAIVAEVDGLFGTYNERGSELSVVHDYEYDLDGVTVIGYRYSSINVVAGGSGFTSPKLYLRRASSSTWIEVPEAVITLGGVSGILGVQVIDSGFGYTNPSLVITSAEGSGATFSFELTEELKVNPNVYVRHQQRDVYAGTSDNPMGIWGSVPATEDDFGVSVPPAASDAFIYELDADDVQPIKYAEKLRSGILFFTRKFIYQLRGISDAGISATAAKAELVSNEGVADLSPIVIGLDILYLNEQSTALTALVYTDYESNTFKPQDVSVLSNHLFGENNSLTYSAYIASPYKLANFVREDGHIVCLAYDRAQEVFGWTPYNTQGLYKDVAAVREGRRTAAYTLVERQILNEWVWCLEREQPRVVNVHDKCWYVDAGRANTLEQRAATLSYSGPTGIVTVTASAAVFTADDIGSHIAAAGGKLEVITYASPTEITALIIAQPTSVVRGPAGQVTLVPTGPGDWSIGPLITTLGNLWHLEGQTVSLFADGDALFDAVVSGGEVTLPRPSMWAVSGLGYSCEGQGLPTSLLNVTVDGRKRNIRHVAARVHETRGLEWGSDFDDMDEMPSHTDEAWGSPLKLQSSRDTVYIGSGWSLEDGVCFRQRYPLPASVLGYVLSADFSDD